MSELDKILERLKAGLAETGNVIVFKDIAPPFQKLTDACVDYLKHVGYSVHGPLVYTRKIKSLDDLIALFYGLLQQRGFAMPYRDDVIERKIAKEFVAARQEADGISKEKAMSQCAELMQIVFNNLERFNFEGPLNFRIFGQGRMGWVTKVAVEIMNQTIVEIEDKLSDKIIDKYTKQLADREVSLLSEDEIDEQLRLIEEKEKLNGKKEK